MKNSINIFLACAIVIGMIACDTAGNIDSFQIGEESALAAWVSSPDGDLILSDPTSALSFEVEFIDATDGSSVEAFTMTVTDGTNSGTLINQTSFSANDDGNQGFSGSFSLNDIAGALGVTVASLEEEDEFDFSSTITRGGTVLATGNASQFHSSIRDFSAAIGVETVSVAVTVKKSDLNAGATSEVIMAFANDFTIELATLPTLEVINGGTGTFSAVTAVLDEDGDDSVYVSTYTQAGLVEEDVDFRIIGAEAVDGYTMVADTTEEAFSIDLTAPTIGTDISGAVATGYRFYLESEAGLTVELMEDFAGVDDDGDGDIDGADADGDAVAVSGVAFSGRTLDYTYEWVTADGAVTLTLKVTDDAENEAPLAAGTATVNLN